jgi:hypothetical protein
VCLVQGSSAISLRPREASDLLALGHTAEMNPNSLGFQMKGNVLCWTLINDCVPITNLIREKER